jgi:hypothetical protein
LRELVTSMNVIQRVGTIISEPMLAHPPIDLRKSATYARALAFGGNATPLPRWCRLQLAGTVVSGAELRPGDHTAVPCPVRPTSIRAYRAQGFARGQVLKDRGAWAKWLHSRIDQLALPDMP